VSLHVVEHPGDGARVVLVHGSMDRSTSFGRVAKLLGDLDVVAYDRHGYGHSLVTPPHRSLAAHASDLVTILDGRRAVVVGHSYGGDVALLAAIERPDLVAAVGAFEAPMPWAPWWPASSAGGAAMEAASPADAAEAFMRRVVGDRIWTRLPRATRDARRAEGETLVAEMESIRGTGPFDPADVGVPVVSGYGTDTEERHRASATRLAESVPDGELFAIEGAGHGAHMSHPRQFADFIRRVVERGDLL
jgi:pimeloyl-ACP methyl ester carboxylesterase